jgi:site-specific DNA recombinase
MTKGLIYVRVSSPEQVRNLSLATQEEVCRDYCQHEGIEVVRVFREEGESAKTADRTQLNAMLMYCRQSKVDYVVVYAVDRFTRRTRDHANLGDILAGLGVRLRSATQTIDETPTGEFTATILSAVAQLDNAIRSERSINGMKARLQEGGWTFKAPIGYLNSKDSTGKKILIPDPERAPIVRQIFGLFATGLYTKEEVRRTATRLGLRTKAGKPLSGQTLVQLMRKPVYAGRVEVKKWEVKEKGDFEPLVSDFTFDQVQAILDGRRPALTPRNRNHPDFPLRHFVRCGYCNRPLTASWSKGRKLRYAYYFCQNRPCRLVKIRKEGMERLFVQMLSQLRPQPEYLELFREVVLDVWKER